MAGTLEARLERPGADVEREQARLDKDLAQLRLVLAQTEERLADERFLARAPAAIIASTRERAAELRRQIDRLAGRGHG